MWCITFSGVILQGDATAAGAEALRAEAHKSVEKNSVRILKADIFRILTSYIKCIFQGLDENYT